MYPSYSNPFVNWLKYYLLNSILTHLLILKSTADDFFLWTKREKVFVVPCPGNFLCYSFCIFVCQKNSAWSTGCSLMNRSKCQGRLQTATFSCQLLKHNSLVRKGSDLSCFSSRLKPSSTNWGIQEKESSSLLLPVATLPCGKWLIWRVESISYSPLSLFPL